MNCRIAGRFQQILKLWQTAMKFSNWTRIHRVKTRQLETVWDSTDLCQLSVKSQLTTLSGSHSNGKVGTHFPNLLTEHRPNFTTLTGFWYSILAWVNSSDGSKKMTVQTSCRTLKCLTYTMQRWLCELDIPVKIATDPEFKHYRQTLDEKMELFIRSGKEQPINSAEPIFPNQENELWERNLLGYKSPKQLLNTVYFLLCKHFGIRSRDEHRSLRAINHNSQLKFITAKGVENLQYRPDNLAGRQQSNSTSSTYTMFGNPSLKHRNPVWIMKVYCERVPPKAEHFYCRPVNCVNHLGEWFLHQPVGVNALCTIIPSLARDCGWPNPEQYRSHSLTFANKRHCDTCNTTCRVKKFSRHRHDEASKSFCTNRKRRRSQKTEFLLHDEASKIRCTRVWIALGIRFICEKKTWLSSLFDLFL